MKWIKKSKLSRLSMRAMLAALLYLLGLASPLHASELQTQQHGKGFIPSSPEQLEKIEQTWPRIVGVKPNQVGVDRILEHMKTHGIEALELIPASPDEEFDKVVGASAIDVLGASSAATLPTSVNNSSLPSFPPIGDQQQEGSCVAWGSTYYQASHEVGLLNGFNNKTSNVHVLSPRWTYNLLNGGVDGGLIPDYAFVLLASNGAPSINSFPYVNGDVTSWDLNPQDWIAAISNRIAPAQYVTGIGGQTQNLATIKQLLTNGHVVTFATFIDSWVFTKILNDPANPNGPYVGQYACTYMNGTVGGHFMTIIGYDDNVWIDVNGNGQVDAGERGAFLVANSWGSSWGNAGYIWISYDAFLNTSAVPNGPSANRVAAASAENNYVFAVVPKAMNYSPSLIGQFTLNQSYRNQISVKAGISNVSQTTPSQTFQCYGLMNQGGPLEFNGTTPGTAQTATFAVDMTDLLGTSTTAERYYLVTGDNTAGNPTTLTAYTLMDLVHKTQVNCSGLPQQCDNSQIQPYIDYTFTNNPPPTPPVVSITAPADNATVQGTINISVNATSNVGITKVVLFLDTVLYATDTAAPYQFTLDTTKLSNGSHSLAAVAYDTAGNYGAYAISVNVMNTTFTPIDINCGGPAVTSNGINYSADKNYTLPSYTYTNTSLTFFEPVYYTQRYGTNFSYNFTVPNGQYFITLQLAEIYFKKPNKRVFSININGNRFITNLDLIAAAGYGVPYLTGYPVTVTNGNININFVSSVNNAAVSAIQITKTN